ncbi:hypothetical protein IMG5_000910 [Ichthyophthirius multifiliis]|uniref:Cyclic nucleotide-binding domain-containing protein n=1 Tax=Ichthyophthirius multifiliis TaxID=5932 RepID=G0QIX8_ICHMU|nr:hypothetical protein IMG5_000910 [Ichthyophthirius multifiliis]EGR34863.1 hypothetical protein IMG5_000910 [Ichthyophthirius multifiliis]|eukprot:XP_004040167.1 hypothetical protein IMG5_000910 [Ichthyophthirius multifiliis]
MKQLKIQINELNYARFTKTQLKLQSDIAKLSENELFENAISSLNIPSNKRNMVQLRLIEIQIDKFPYIQKLKKQNQNLSKQVAKISEYKKAQKGQVIIYTGTDPDNFYLILKGKVAVLLPKISDQIEQERQQGEIVNLQNIVSQQNSNNNNNSYPQKQPISNNVLNYQYSEQTNTIEKKNIQNIIKSPISNKNIQKFICDINIQEGVNQNQNNSDSKMLSNYICKGVDLFVDELKEPHNLYENGIFKYEYVKDIKQYEVFGEIGILLKIPRSATIIATENCDLISISKYNYESLINRLEEMKMFKKIQFYRDEVFKIDINNQDMTKIIINFAEKQKYKNVLIFFYSMYINQLLFLQNYFKNQYIFKQNDDVKQVFIIKRGEIKLTKTMEDNQKQIDISVLTKSEFLGSEDIVFQRKKDNLMLYVQVKSFYMFVILNYLIEL